MNVLLQTLWTWVSTSEGFILEQGCSAKPLSLASSRWLKQEPADPLPTRPGPACRVQLLSQECFSLFSFFFFSLCWVLAVFCRARALCYGAQA